VIWAWVTTQFEGYHKWDDAPEDVAFLRDKHRHIFYVKVYVEQFHDDRDVEFILLKRWLDGLIASFDKENLGSCEMIAGVILEHLMDGRFRKRAYKVEVSEDRENGALVEGHGGD
jgi:hypothetical protein